MMLSSYNRPFFTNPCNVLHGAGWWDADSAVACNTDLLKSFHAILCRVDSPSANPVMSNTWPVEEVGAAKKKREGRSELLLPCLKKAFNNKEWMT